MIPYTRAEIREQRPQYAVESNNFVPTVKQEKQ